MESAANSLSYLINGAISPVFKSTSDMPSSNPSVMSNLRSRVASDRQRRPPLAESPGSFKGRLSRFRNRMWSRNRILINLINEITKSGCNSQSQSPLYKIPAEIREHIFSYVLSESDGKNEISKPSYWYRPDYPAFRYIDTNLLRTCRRIWMETYTLPRRNVSARIWLGSNDRCPPRRFAYAKGVNEEILFPALETNVARRIIYPNESLQVFAQMYALEWGQLNDAVQDASKETSPRRITITLRYTDWWNWEVDETLRIQDAWSKEFIAPSSTEEIILELETRNGKKRELDALISKQVSKWTFHRADDVDLVLHGKPREELWVGSAKPGGVTYEHHHLLQNGPGTMQNEDEMLYYVVQLRWKKAA